MTIREFAYKTSEIARKHGYQKALKSASKEAFAKIILREWVSQKQREKQAELRSQKSLLDELRSNETYTLVVLDAGRYDYLAPILSDLFKGDVEPVFSDARDTFEWISKTWQGNYQDVTYLSGMVPVSDEIPDFDAEEFKRLYDGINPGDSIGEIIKLWESHWDSHLSTVPPDTITDVALDHSDLDKLVIHYNQPHSPYIGTPQLLGHSENKSAEPKQGQPNDKPIWERVRAGSVSDPYLHAAYVGNCVQVVESLKPLIQERKNVVITTDHGEALGEYGMYTHDRAPHPKRRVIPWMKVNGIQTENQTEREMDLNGRLEALGYR